MVVSLMRQVKWAYGSWEASQTEDGADRFQAKTSSESESSLWSGG